MKRREREMQCFLNTIVEKVIEYRIEAVNGERVFWKAGGLNLMMEGQFLEDWKPSWSLTNTPAT